MDVDKSTPMIGICLAILFAGTDACAQIRDPAIGMSGAPRNQTLLNQTMPRTRSVPRPEYMAAVAQLQRAVAETERARQALALQVPRDGPPSPIDCYFHPWHPGCDKLFGPVTLPLMTDAPPPQNPVIRWVASNWAWGALVCLYKADVGGQGLETDVGLQKALNCLQI